MTTSLQGLGYDFVRAVADIVDNSVTAGAKNVWVDIKSDTDPSEGLGPYVLITDDGKGMTARGLVKAMQYGAESDDDDRALGRFGLGLKTASTSQGNRLTVASRRGESSNFAARAWDLDYLQDRGDGRWFLLNANVTEYPGVFKKRLRGRSGTGVLWTRLDILLPDRERMSESHLDKRMNRLALDAAEHLALVFHRFLTGNTRSRRRKLRMFVNGRALDPFDPLLPEHRKTKTPKPPAPYTIHDGEGIMLCKFQVETAILPRQDQFVDGRGKLDEPAHRRAGGPKGWNAAQGFYIYRLDRLIQGGGWSNMRANDEHTKLARVAVDIDRAADEVFRLNVAKTRVLFPAAVRDEIKEYTATVATAARRVYGEKHGSGRERSSSASEGHSGTGKSAGGGKSSATGKTRAAKSTGAAPSTTAVLRALYESCKNSGERKTLVEIIRRKYPGFKPRR